MAHLPGLLSCHSHPGLQFSWFQFVWNTSTLITVFWAERHRDVPPSVPISVLPRNRRTLTLSHYVVRTSLVRFPIARRRLNERPVALRRWRCRDVLRFLPHVENMALPGRRAPPVRLESKPWRCSHRRRCITGSGGCRWQNCCITDQPRRQVTQDSDDVILQA